MNNGTVKFFNNAQGKQFGFIQPDDPGPEVFFSYDFHVYFDAERLVPRKGDRVSFLSVDESRGPRVFIWMWEFDWKSMSTPEEELSLKETIALLLV